MKPQIFFTLLLLPLLSACIAKSDKNIIITVPQEEPVEIYRPIEVVYTPTITTSMVNSQVLETAWSHLDQGDDWTKFTQNAIRDYGQDLLKMVPTDVTKYCSKYPSLNNHGRGDFWVQLISKLAYFESSYRPEITYTEEFSDNRGENVISRGLLQLSIESANGNYGCGLSQATELHDPKTNLECGVRIFNKLVLENGVINARVNGAWKGAARYWSPFRTGDRNKKLMEYTNTLELCRLD